MAQEFHSAVDTIHARYLRGLDKHPSIGTITDLMCRMNEAWDEYRAAHNTCLAITGDDDLRRTLEKLACIAIRGLTDLDLPDPPWEQENAPPHNNGR